ncbi:MAG: hypothetical protein AB1627_02445 [Chloroflexota bacterium]
MTVDPLALLLVAGLLLVKEAGVPLPVPGDLLVLGAGVAAAAGPGQPVLAAALLIAATIVGGTIQYRLLRGTGRRALVALLGRVGLGEPRIEGAAARLGRGPRAVAVARMTPGVRIVAIPAFAFAGIPARAFVLGLAAGNAVFVGAHFALGFVLGEPAVTLVGRTLGPAAIGALALAAVGAAGWFLLARRRGAAMPGTVLDWTDAACPACLALAAVGQPAFAADRGRPG